MRARIADQWKIDTGTVGKSDLDDSEVTPGGDGHPGDGLSLYEEYRGFYVNGKHIQGDPTKKELFVMDLTNEQYGGIALYSKLTGIVVHTGLLASELSDINVNLLNRARKPLR